MDRLQAADRQIFHPRRLFPADFEILLRGGYNVETYLHNRSVIGHVWVRLNMLILASEEGKVERFRSSQGGLLGDRAGHAGRASVVLVKDAPSGRRAVQAASPPAPAGLSFQRILVSASVLADPRTTIWRDRRVSPSSTCTDGSIATSGPSVRNHQPRPEWPRNRIDRRSRASDAETPGSRWKRTA